VAEAAYYRLTLTIFTQGHISGVVRAFGIVENGTPERASYPLFSLKAELLQWLTAEYVTAVTPADRDVALILNLPHDAEISARLTVERLD
jgi:hypothetical protein